MTQTFKIITEAGDTEITFRFIEMECIGDSWVISAVYESEKPVNNGEHPELSALREKLSEEEKRNELFSDCLRRGLKLWQAENPDRDYWISGDENIKWMLDQIAALRERVEALEAALSVTTQAYLAILKEQEWTTSDGHPAEWHALIVSNKELLQAP